jgi:hypothetical protein
MGNTWRLSRPVIGTTIVAFLGVCIIFKMRKSKALHKEADQYGLKKVEAVELRDVGLSEPEVDTE